MVVARQSNHAAIRLSLPRPSKGKSQKKNSCDSRNTLTFFGTLLPPALPVALISRSPAPPPVEVVIPARPGGGEEATAT